MSNSKRDLEKEKHWREVLSSWRASGVSKARFCRERGLKLSTLCSWVSVIESRDAEQRNESVRAARKRRLEIETNEKKEKKTSVEFVEAKCSNRLQRLEAPQAETERIEISTQQGLLIKLPAASNSALLFAVLQALR